MKTRILFTIIMVFWATVMIAQNNVGIGVTNPLEILHLNGAAVVGGRANIGSELPGTIEWNGNNFVGWMGPSVFVHLDGQSHWQMIPSGYVPLPPFPLPLNPELVPMTPPSSLSMSYPGDPNQGGIVWIPDRPLPGVYPHQLMLESTTNALQSDASMLFRMSNWTNYDQGVPPSTIDDYSLGIFRGDMSFKIYRGSILTATTQGDAFSMFRANASGIIDLPNQSRVRATVTNIDWASWQLIQPSTWTPVNYTSPVSGSPLFPGAPVWDEQGEFTNATSPNQSIVANIPNSFFTAQEEGFYQVNARCEFEPDDYMDGAGNIFPVYMRPNAFVSIAVYIEVAGAPVQWNSHAIGNNLQVTNNVFIALPPSEYPDATAKITNNNAPNVSDVIYLQAGDRVSIWVFHWAYTPMMIRVGDDKLYFSIHKIS